MENNLHSLVSIIPDSLALDFGVTDLARGDDSTGIREGTRSERFWRHSFVRSLRAVCVLCIGAALLFGFADEKPNPALAPLLAAVENRYNHADSLRLDFTETYAASRRPVQNESGTLWLRKPGRMRWEYRQPAGKLFVSDGKDVFLYTPQDNRAVKTKLKQSEDMRAPLAFLLGKLSFQKEFRSFQSRPEGEGTWIVAEPKSENLAYTKVEFLATAAGEIRQVRVTGQDQSKLDFSFSNQTANPPVPAGKFAFQPPAGAEIVVEDGAGQ